MPSPLDWLDVSPQPQTSLFAPAVSPYRNYGLSAADAVRQGRQALPNLQAATTYADLMRQQSLAPMQQQVEQMRLQTQLEVQPQINEGRDLLIQRLSALDPASDDYLTQRRDAVMQNPYGLADPFVQQVLQNNDRAYDDYISTKRLSMYNTPRTLTPGQTATIQRQITNTTEALNKARVMGDTAMADRYAQELDALNGIIAGSGTGAPAGVVATTPGAAAPPTTAGQRALEASRMAGMSEPERWTAAKDKLAEAIAAEAAQLQTTVAEIQAAMTTDPAYVAEILDKRLGVKPREKVFDAPDSRSWWNGGTEVTWEDMVETMLLPENKSVLKGRDTAPEGKWDIQIIK